MKNFFSIGEAAKAVHATSETLRHYDRIGLVKPSRKDAWTKYRYYTTQDIIRLNTVRALQQMDLPLQEIKAVLEYDSLERIIEFLTAAEEKADEKIAAIQQSKQKIQTARQAYERNLREQQTTAGAAVVHFPERVILLSDTLETPEVDTLWNYLSHFYNRIPAAQRDAFLFEDMAGIYTEQGRSRLFAVCIHYSDIAGLKTLPAGRYLCAACTEEDRIERVNELLRLAEKDYRVTPAFTVQKILVSGILQWRYQAQVYIGT